MVKGSKLEHNPEFMVLSSYRPFVKKYLHNDPSLIKSACRQPIIFPVAKDNLVICLSQGTEQPFCCIAVDTIPSKDLTGAGGGTQCFPLCLYENNKRIENITDYALYKFQDHYNDETITRLNIFHYVYAVLHNPKYREKYKINLTREFPYIPFYDDFQLWLMIGQSLMDIHLDYETINPYPLQRIDKHIPKAKLKAIKTQGTILLDIHTSLQGIPPEVWNYKFGHRSALEWVLYQYKERKPRDPTIRDRFNTYRFIDYKEHVIELLQKVCTVSIETMKIIAEMRTII